ncbi:MAG TPA: nucleotidyltransferase family protein [Acidobacteriaceae bacterium]|jgi:hypothetical protein|nr:nucleotidyltransferase family protein [Acidobacteriaceae bacterium]
MRAQPIGNGLLTARVSRECAAVVAALQLQGGSAEALLAIDDPGWKKVLAYCDRMQLTLPLAVRSSREFPWWVSERLTGNLALTARRFLRAQATYREAAAALGAADIPHVVLKGFTQAPDFVRAPQWRTQSDIDLYTDREHIEAATGALEAIGYESSGPPEIYRLADHVPTLTRYRGWKPGATPFDLEMPLAFDLHYCLWNSAVSLIELPEVDEFWNRRVERRLGDFSFTALSGVDHLGYFALHVLRELFAGGRVLHHALELANFLHARADDQAFWGEWQTVHSPRLRQLQAISLTLAAAIYSSRVPDAVREQLEKLPPAVGAWIETCGGDLMATSFRRSRDGRLLQCLVADSAATRRKLLWKAFAPGAIASARSLAWRPDDGAEPQRRQLRETGRYLAYLASRVSLNCLAVLRMAVNGLTVFLLTCRHRGDAVS